MTVEREVDDVPDLLAKRRSREGGSPLHATLEEDETSALGANGANHDGHQERSNWDLLG